jgi:hypothetical protein
MRTLDQTTLAETDMQILRARPDRRRQESENLSLIAKTNPDRFANMTDQTLLSLLSPPPNRIQ